MSSKHMARCGCYSDRPAFCREYPKEADVRPGACTIRFLNGEKVGSCQPEVCQDQACCNWPRENGDPEGAAATRTEGGKPCRFLKWEDAPEEKVADDAATFDAGETADLFFRGVVATEL